MKVIIKGTNLTLTDAIKSYITKKVEPVTKFLKKIDAARVEIEFQPTHYDGNKFRAEVNLDIANKVVRAESRSIDVYAAIDLLFPKLVVQLEKVKEKNKSRIRSTRRKIKEGLI